MNCKSAEVELSAEEALIAYNELKSMNSHINYKTEPNLWLEYYFQSMQLSMKLENQHEEVLRLYNNLGYNFRIFKLHRESLYIYKRFFKYYAKHESEFSQQLKEEAKLNLTYNFRSAAYAYENLGYLDSAYLMHQKNLEFIKTSNTIFKPAAHNDFGIFLVGSKKDTIAALEEFKKAYKNTSNEFPEHELIASIRDNLGNIYLNKNMLEDAFNAFYANFFYYKKYLQKENRYELKILVTVSKLMEILKLQNRIDLQSKIYAEINNIYQTSLVTKHTNHKLKLELLKIKMHYILGKNDFEKSFQILENIKSLSDSINLVELIAKEKLQITLNELSLRGIKDKYNLEKKQKESELLNQRLITWLISIIAIIFIAVLAFLYDRRKQFIVHAKNEQHIIQQDLELSSIRNKQLNLEIESKKRDLADFAINLSQNQEWAKVLAEKLEILKATKGRKRKNLMDDLENEVLKKTTFDSNTKEFYAKLDQLSDSFYSRLYEEFPHLSKTEKRLCSLIRLKIESPNIAAMQNISLSSLNTSRYRLRKKLNLNKEDDLDDFIQTL